MIAKQKKSADAYKKKKELLMEQINTKDLKKDKEYSIYDNIPSVPNTAILKEVKSILESLSRQDIYSPFLSSKQMHKLIAENETKFYSTFALLVQLRKTLREMENEDIRSANRIRELFNSVDTSGDGKLSSSEIMEWFHLLRIKVTDKDINALFIQYDLDLSGVISYDVSVISIT